MNEPFWASAEEEARVLAVVRRNPYERGMDPVAYAEMVAILAGLMKPEAAVLQRSPSTR